MTAYTTDQIVEAMAREIDPITWQDVDGQSPDWYAEQITCRLNSLHEARAALAKALEMMQEPTEEQILAAGYLPVPDIRWRAMIQARREELG